MTLLHIDSSPRLQGSHSRNVAQGIADKLQATHKTTYTDLTTMDLPHISQEYIEATFVAKEERTEETAKILSIGDTFIKDIQSADTVLISLPMYNFGIPSTLKAYIDYISRMGETFTLDMETLTTTGLLTNKKLILIAAYGLEFSEIKSMDYVEPYLKSLFGFLGFEDITYLTIEGTSVLAPKRIKEKEASLVESFKL